MSIPLAFKTSRLYFEYIYYMLQSVKNMLN